MEFQGERTDPELACEARKKAKQEESKQISDQEDLPVVTKMPVQKEEKPSRQRKQVTKRPMATSHPTKRPVATSHPTKRPVATSHPTK